MKRLIIIWMLFISTAMFAQETVFSLMKSSSRLGDREFERGEYETAIDYYKRALAANQGNTDVLARLAQCYYNLKDYSKCVETYDTMAGLKKPLNWNETFRYAEAQSALGNYDAAIAYYKRCLDGDKENELVSKKIWALSNINFLREDSSHYRVSPLTAVNTRASELGAVQYSTGIVFISNKKGTRPVDLATDEPSGPFYELYVTKWSEDSVSKEKTFKKPLHFATSLGLSQNAGPVAFFDGLKKMAFIASASKPGEDGSRSLGLYFAEFKDSKWKVTSVWAHNSDNYSITDITINEEGTRLYFSSNMKGGSGGKDIYTSILKADGNWTKPSNLGEIINTKGDEVFPYLHRNGTLYFSSDGHPGIGGLDIFQSAIRPNGFSEPENIGYPVNSHADDFGLTFDSLATHGYFSSNRGNGGFDDDIYQFEMDLQTYPFQMTGVLKYKAHTYSDTTDIHIWSNAKLKLVDTWQGTELQETTTGSDGVFSLTIPYFSRYHILVTDEKGIEHKASLELEKYRTEAFRYEIVVVKDLFAELKEDGQK